MRRVAVSIMVCVTALPVGVLGAILLGLTEHFDSFQSVRVAQMKPEVAEQAQALDRFLEIVVRHTLADVEQTLGQSVGSCPDSTYAMPLCQGRMVGFGGFGCPTIRPEFYPVGLVGGLQIWYYPDSTTVATSVVYLKVDSLFTPFNRSSYNNFGTRLSWDRDHLAALMQALEWRFGKLAPPDGVLQPLAWRDCQR